MVVIVPYATCNRPYSDTKVSVAQAITTTQASSLCNSQCFYIAFAERNKSTELHRLWQHHFFRVSPDTFVKTVHLEKE